MKVVTYIRVSTKGQGESGLGLEAQQYSVEQFVKGREVIGVFREVESGKKNDRPELQKALGLCKETGSTLVIAKLDRLSRNAAFLLTLRDSGVEFVCCDCPNADRFTVGILALVAEREREMISQRTKDGLAAAKRRGVKLGNPTWKSAIKKMSQGRSKRAANYRSMIGPVMSELREAKVTSAAAMARCLKVRGFKTPFGHEFLTQTVNGLTRSILDRRF